MQTHRFNQVLNAKTSILDALLVLFLKVPLYLFDRFLYNSLYPAASQPAQESPGTVAPAQAPVQAAPVEEQAAAAPTRKERVWRSI